MGQGVRRNRKYLNSKPIPTVSFEKGIPRTVGNCFRSHGNFQAKVFAPLSSLGPMGIWLPFLGLVSGLGGRVTADTGLSGTVLVQTILSLLQE